jgi:hypothetical protein
MSVGVATEMPVELRFSTHKTMFINRLKQTRERERERERERWPESWATYTTLCMNKLVVLV